MLELGGSDPFIVMPSADLDAAVKTAVHGAHDQQRTVVHRRQAIHRRTTRSPIDSRERFVARMKELVVGDPMDEATNIGPLATKQIRDDLDDQVKRSVAQGARVLLGGKPRDGEGWYYEPTVLDDVSTDSPAFREEIFGPLAAIIRARDLDHAIELANDSRFGLGAAAWTRDDE